MTDKAKILPQCLGQAQPVKGLIDYANCSIVSKAILNTLTGSITLFAFDAEQSLSEHTSPYNAVIIAFDGSAKITIGGTEQLLSSGQMIILPANIPHSVYAVEKFKMILVMIRP